MLQWLVTSLCEFNSCFTLKISVQERAPTTDLAQASSTVSTDSATEIKSFKLNMYTFSLVEFLQAILRVLVSRLCRLPILN